MSIYWSETAKNIDPYVPGEQPKDKKYIKLNTNENPYSPSPRVLDEIRRSADESLRLYPDPDCDELCSTIAKYYGLKKEQVFAGNGSDELLAFSFMAFFNPGSTILFPDITYSFYPVYSGLFNIKYRTVPLDDGFGIPEEGFLTENGGIIFPNPNAPTGKYLGLEAINRILAANRRSVVIIDEAYVDFGAESAVKLINGNPNLLVLQTFSKSRSLAGMRVGFAMGNSELIEGLNRIKNSFNSYTVDRVAMAAAIEAIRDEDYFQETRMRIIRTRERISADLSQLGFEMPVSKSNFLLIKHTDICAEELFNKLRENGILVRYFDKPRLSDYLRVTIGSDEEMDCLTETIRKILMI